VDVGAAALDGVDIDVARERRDQRGRAVALLLLVAFVGAGLVGAFGVRTGTARASAPSGLELRVTHPRVARPALAVDLSIEVRRPGGFDGQIDLTMPTSYLAAFDENGFTPEPDSSTTDARSTTWTFDPPGGEVLTVWLDTRIEPGVQWKREGRATVETGGEVLEVSFTTWIAP
jgi:hypothetical protein